MLEFDRKQIRTYSLIGSHRTLGQAALHLPEICENVAVIVSDQCSPAGLEYFRDKFPDKFYNVGIAEQNMLGIAAGMAKEGFRPYVVAQAAFAVGRCFDQIKLNLGYMNLGVKVVGLSSGLSIGTYGATHMCIEDFALTRSIPNIVVLSPADCTEATKAILESAKNDKPTYIRLTGWINNPVVYKEDYNFEIGKAITLKEGSDIAIIATGSMVHHSLKASKLLEEKEISAKVINMHTIKPLDYEILDDIIKNYNFVVTAEEHFKTGGLGSAVAEYLSKFENSPKQLAIGIDDYYTEAGSYEYLMDKYGLTAEKMTENIMKNYK